MSRDSFEAFCNSLLGLLTWLNPYRDAPGALSSVQNVERIAVRRKLETRAQGFLVLVEFRLQQKALDRRPVAMACTFCIFGGSSFDLLLLATPVWSVCLGNFL